MRTVKNLVICVLMLVLVSAAGAATTYYVNPGDSIQDAIDAADPGDEIAVAPGIYEEAINFKGKAIRLYSDPAGDATIDASGLNCPVVTCNSGEGADTRLEGFVVTGGNAVNGGGMYNSGSSPTVTNCIFTDNSATGGLVTTWEPGLWYGTLPGNINTTDPNPQTSVTTDLMETEDDYLPENTTEVYTGQIWVPFSGTTSFTEYNDDKTRLYIDLDQNGDFDGGELVLSSDDWTDRAEGSATLMAGQWYGFELRMSNGDGPGGIVEAPCFGYMLPSSGDYVHPEDPDDVSLFRHEVITGAESEGGGMYNINSSPTVTGCTFTGNTTTGYGGGMSNNSSSPEVTGCTFESNSAQHAGGMYNDNGSSPTVTDCTFSNNTAAGSGGGMRNVESDPIIENCTFTANSGYYAGGLSSIRSNPTLTGCSFISNSASNAAGGMGTYYGDPELTNCTFTGNSAAHGGGVNFDHSPEPTLTNCTFANNSADNGGGGVNNWDSAPTVTGCTFSGNEANYGGGMHNSGSSPTVTDCEFSGNQASSDSGGMHNCYDSSPNVTNCTFTANHAAGQGGAMVCYSGGSPTVTDCTFSDNSADDKGGGMYNQESSPSVDNCSFSGNSAGYSGGGMYNYDSSPTVTDCTFSGNNGAHSGGGMCNWPSSSPTVTNCNFSGNQADYGGAMRNDYGSNPSITNCSFSSNSADYGGGMFNSFSSPMITNCTFSGNSSSYGGGGMHNFDSSPTVTNCILWGNTPDEIGDDPMSSTTVSYSDVQSVVWPGTGNIDEDPLFVDATAGDLRLASSASPCVDTGQDPPPPELPDTDLAGNSRVVDGDENGSAIVDMGAYEFQPGPIHNITQNIWYGTIQSAIDYANDDDLIAVGPGTYHEAIDFLGKAIELCSTGGPEATTIDGGGAYHVVQCVSGEGIDTTLEGFTITGGNADAGWPNERGAGMYNQGSSPTVNNCIFIENTTVGYGGGMSNNWSSPTVTDCTFEGNSSDNHCGGMHNDHCSPTVTGCIFTGNSAGSNGGGMGNTNDSSPNLTNCTFSANSANYGGGISNMPECNPTVTNCTFTGNSADYGGGVNNYESEPILTNCTFSGNNGSNGTGMNNINCSPNVTGCTFSGNTASGYGGGMYNDQSSPTVADCTFADNIADAGGGMSNYPESSPTLTDCIFTGNSARAAGGMHNHENSSPQLTNCIFTGNSASEDCGGMSNHSGSNAILINCIFTGNEAGYAGGGIQNAYSTATMTNCTFIGNTASLDGRGGGIRDRAGSNSTVTNCILWGNTPDEIFVYESTPIVTYSDVQGGWPGADNIDANPMFADAEGRLSSGSPCIEAGDNGAVPGDIENDLDGNPRIADGDRDEVEVVDMGAYEYVWTDADADGIEDSVDTAPGVSSDDFDDGSTSGTILDRADQILFVSNAPDPCGVRISASGGAEPAQVSVCGKSAFYLDAGDAVVATCGSVEITVVQGTVEIVFVADDGTEAQTSLNEGNGIKFEPETCTISAPSTNSEDVIVIVDGEVLILAPGENKMFARIDIDPDTLSLKSKGKWITCYIELPQGFDVDDIDVGTVTLSGEVIAEPHPTAVGDYDNDGVADLMVKFDLSATQAILEAADAVQISVAGQLNDGTVFEGSDTIRVIKPGGKNK